MGALHDETKQITAIILKAAEKARREVDTEPEPEFVNRAVNWPVVCEVGPGLEGAIACESKVGYVNGTKGWLVYRGYDIFDLAAHSTFEEVSYLLLHGSLPDRKQLADFNRKLIGYRHLPWTISRIMSFPMNEFNAMAGLRLGVNMMRQRLTYRDSASAHPEPSTAIGTDEDSIPMEVRPYGEEHAKYEFKAEKPERPEGARLTQDPGFGLEACCHLVAGLATVCGAVARLRQERLPIEPDPQLSHAANFLYMMTGRRPTPIEERVMDIALILHADHGMNASTFACMVVASTLSDIYWAVGSGISALNGPLHGGANEQVVRTLLDIGAPSRVNAWFRRARARKQRVMGFGHRVYKAYDPRARILAPLAEHLARTSRSAGRLWRIGRALEEKVVAELGASRRIFPNVDFFSGMVYTALGIPSELFTPIFAVSRVSGWTARTMEYLDNNRIFRPRAMYTGELGLRYSSMRERSARRADRS